MPPENPLCRYYPSLPHLSEIHGVNTECVEQAFRWLNNVKLANIQFDSQILVKQSIICIIAKTAHFWKRQYRDSSGN